MLRKIEKNTSTIRRGMEDIRKDSKGIKRLSRKRWTITASEMKSTLNGLKANKTLQKKR